MEKTNNFELLSQDELNSIYGGKPSADTSFAYDVAWTIGAVARGIWEFASAAAEYQSSLPPNLKK